MNIHEALIVSLVEMASRTHVSREEWASACRSDRLAAVVVALVAARLPGRRDGSGRFVKQVTA